MKNALVIKTSMLLRQDTINKYQQIFANQLKTGVVIIPNCFDAELLNVPTDVEVIVEATTQEEFFSKYLKGEKDVLSN